MKKLYLLLAVFLIATPVMIYADHNENDVQDSIVERRVVVRQVYREYSYMGYTFCVEGTYTTLTDGTVVDSSLTARAISSGCTVSSLEQSPSGTGVFITLNVNTPVGGGSLVDVIH